MQSVFNSGDVLDGVAFPCLFGLRRHLLEELLDLEGRKRGGSSVAIEVRGGRDWKRLEGSFLIFLRFLLHVVVGFAQGVCFSHIDLCFPSPKSILVPCSHAILVFAMP